MVPPFFMRSNQNPGSSLRAEQALLTLPMLYIYQGMMAKTCNLCHFFRTERYFETGARQS